MDYKTCMEERDNFLRYLTEERHTSRHTYSAYAQDLDQFLNWWQQYPEGSSQLLGPMFHAYTRYLSRTTRLHSTIARKISAFNGFLRFLKKQEYDITITLKRPQYRTDTPKTVDIDCIKKLFKSIHPETIASKFLIRDLAILELIYATGLRSSDIINLEIGHVDFSEHTIKCTNCTGNQQPIRVIPFSTYAHKALIAYLKNERPTPTSPHEKLFLNQRKLPLSARTIQRIFVKFRKCIPLPEQLTPRMLRASCAQHLLEEGAGVSMVKAFLGHKIRISTEKYKK